MTFSVCTQQNVTIDVQNPYSSSLNILYAEMWKCSDNSAINCPIQRCDKRHLSEFRILQYCLIITAAINLAKEMPLPSFCPMPWLSCDSGRIKSSCRFISILTIEYWYRCQDKATCQFDPSLILSHVGPPNNLISPPKPNYVFEWTQESISADSFNCTKYATKSHGSCYRVSYTSLNWSHIQIYVKVWHALCIVDSTEPAMGRRPVVLF